MFGARQPGLKLNLKEQSSRIRGDLALGARIGDETRRRQFVAVHGSAGGVGTENAVARNTKFGM